MTSVPPPARTGRALRAAIYCRVSTPGQEEDGSSLQTQETECRLYIIRNGYTLDERHVYLDVHSGAEFWERPALTAAREAMAARQIDVLVSYDPDRSFRDQFILGALVMEARRSSVRLEFVTKIFDESPQGKFMLSAHAFIAEVERVKIRERTLRGKRARLEAGKLMPGPRALYGYQFTDTRGAYVIDSVTADIVRRIFSAAQRGMTIRGIAAALTADGISTPSGRGTKWSPATVHVILSNRAYTGEAVGWQHSRVGSEPVPLPEGTIPALVDVAMFEAVQVLRTQNKLQSPRNNRTPEERLLRAGYVHCAHCGDTMHGTRASKRRQSYYRCNRNDRVRERVCPAPQIGADFLDAKVWAHVEAILTDPSRIAAKLAEVLGTDPTVEEERTIERQLAALKTRSERAVVSALDLYSVVGAEEKQEFVVHLEQLRIEREQLVAKRDALQEQREKWIAAQDRLADLQAWCGQVANKWGQLTYADRRRTLDYLGVDVLVTAANDYEIQITLPLDPPSVVSSSFSSDRHNNYLTLRWRNESAAENRADTQYAKVTIGTRP